MTIQTSLKSPATYNNFEALICNGGYTPFAVLVRSLFCRVVVGFIRFRSPICYGFAFWFVGSFGVEHDGGSSCLEFELSLPRDCVVCNE